ncbi:MAG TPA: septal ring lytic transglycosylase RlpA family protein [Terriglobales bacterium]|nr:septal ring lytic transglycosylase RlpA family protein [Terriglobales bacterium]
MLRVLSPFAATLVFATALGAAPGNSTPDSQKGAPGQIQEHKPARKAKAKAEVGRASWYGRIFQNKKTASGEPYDMFDLTAAHRSLPIGSWVKVTDLKNSRSVVVRINDRGPVAPSRIIDLSYEAAKVLGMRGVDRVRLEVLPTPVLADNLGPQ